MVGRWEMGSGGYRVEIMGDLVFIGYSFILIELYVMFIYYLLNDKDLNERIK